MRSRPASALTAQPPFAPTRTTATAAAMDASLQQWVVQCEFCVKRIYAETLYNGLCRIHQHAEAAHSSRIPTPAAADAMVRRLPWTRGGG
eukprot:6152880-Heterocapsa_arctica.AAC.1